MDLEARLEQRHPAVQSVARWLTPNPQLSGSPLAIASMFAELAGDLLDELKYSDPELTVGFRKLLEAKDCFVRAAVAFDAVDDAELAAKEGENR